MSISKSKSHFLMHDILNFHEFFKELELQVSS